MLVVEFQDPETLRRQIIELVHDDKKLEHSLGRSDAIKGGS
jgi:hypothetical protein